MSEPTNSSWPFSELPEAEGLDFDKVFGSGSGTTTGDVNPFDANPFDEPQSEASAPVEAPVPIESIAAKEPTPEPTPTETAPASIPAAAPAQPKSEAPAKKSAPAKPQANTTAPVSAPAPETEENPLTAAFSQKTVENAQKGLFEKPPVFCFKNAKEPIEDASMTFEELRIRKIEDFSDLEEGKNVSWSVEYCGIIKQIKDPKGTTIISMKESIERSREFLDALKKAKDKNPDCLVKPKVTMQRKGTLPPYKGSFASVTEARASDKVICLFPSGDGRIYEMHKTEQGEFIAPKNNIHSFEAVRAGFTPALPRVPLSLMGKLIAFFRSFMRENDEYEAMAIIYWDKREQEFFAYVPRQTVSKEQIDADLTDCPYDDESRYIRYADIHSHNSMEAFFSGVDDLDERGTGLLSLWIAFRTPAKKKKGTETKDGSESTDAAVDSTDTPAGEDAESAAVRAQVAKTVREIMEENGLPNEEGDVELKRVVSSFLLLRAQGYTLRVIPGTPEENAPVFDFDSLRFEKNAA